MRKSRTFFLGILLGACIAGALAMLYLPFATKDLSFLSGFTACAVFVLCTWIGFYFLKNKEGLVQGDENGAAPKAVRQKAPRVAVVLFFLLTGLLFVILLFRQDETIKRLEQMQRVQLVRQNELIETTRNAGIVKWMSLVLQQAEDELNQHPNRQLRDETIATIAALSYSFKPYQRFEGDSILLKELSPERGMLLLALCRMRMDTNSMQKILLQSHFAHADLKDADLQSAFLQGADLQGANLQDANLENAQLNQANLNSANVWGATLRHAKLNGAQLKKAELSWADLSGAVLQKADLHEASLVSAQMRKCDLREATLKWADFSSALLDEADLSHTDMFRSTLIRTQLVSTIFRDANLALAILSEANLTGTILAGADLSGTYISDPQWLTHIHAWRVDGAAEIQKGYKIVDGISFYGSRFQLKKVED